MKLLHVIQHTSAEYLGLVEDHLEGRGLRFRYHRPFAGKAALPQASAIDDGLILLGGGPWGSAGGRDLPTLAAEIDIARGCLARGVPVIGIGLGAQIVTLAQGGRTLPAPLAFEIVEAHRTTTDALNGYLPERFPAAIYMRDWPAPPPDATVLATAADGRALVWQSGDATFGFVAHPGIKVAMVEDLVMEFDESPPDIALALAALRQAQRAIEDALVPLMTGLVQQTGWMENA